MLKQMYWSRSQMTQMKNPQFVESLPESGLERSRSQKGMIVSPPSSRFLKVFLRVDRCEAESENLNRSQPSLQCTWTDRFMPVDANHNAIQRRSRSQIDRSTLRLTYDNFSLFTKFQEPNNACAKQYDFKMQANQFHSSNMLTQWPHRWRLLSSRLSIECSCVIVSCLYGLRFHWKQMTNDTPKQ